MGLFATLRHIRRLSEVEDRLRTLEGDFKALDREWSDVHEDLRVMLGKMSKRAKAMEKAQAEAPKGEQHELGAEPAGAHTMAPYGSKTAIIQRQIAARRNGGA